jgi:hypothetical protein
LSNREKSDWRSLVESSWTCARLRCTGLSGVHRTVSGAQAGSLGEQVALGKNSARHDYNSPDCPMSQPCPRQRSAEQSAGDAWTSPTVTRQHQIVRCATSVVATMVGFTRKGRKSRNVPCPVGHRTVRCAHGQKATMAFQMELQRLLAALGL